MDDNFPKIGLGTWDISKDDISPTDDEILEVEMIKSTIRNGFKHIDTAAFFRQGKMEEIVGKAVKGFDRNDLMISSKVLFDLSYDGVLKNFEETLNRMGLDYLDVYYVHAPSGDGIPIKETAKAFNRLLSEGLIKNAGVCNASVKTLKEYHSELNKGVYATQAFYNLLIRGPKSKGVIDYCNENNIHFIAYRCVQMPVPILGIAPFQKAGAYPILDELAAKYDKSNVLISLKWLLQQQGVNLLLKISYPIGKKEIDELATFELSPEDMQNLTDNFPNQQEDGLYLDGTKIPLI